MLNFWFDFLDGDHELQKYGCHSIGNRPKAVNDTSVKAIYFRSTPTIIFYQDAAEKNLVKKYAVFAYSFDTDLLYYDWTSCPAIP